MKIIVLFIMSISYFYYVYYYCFYRCCSSNKYHWFICCYCCYYSFMINAIISILRIITVGITIPSFSTIAVALWSAILSSQTLYDYQYLIQLVLTFIYLFYIMLFRSMLFYVIFFLTSPDSSFLNSTITIGVMMMRSINYGNYSIELLILFILSIFDFLTLFLSLSLHLSSSITFTQFLSIYLYICLSLPLSLHFSLFTCRTVYFWPTHHNADSQRIDIRHDRLPFSSRHL